jgi:hypothetical protein
MLGSSLPLFGSEKPVRVHLILEASYERCPSRRRDLAGVVLAVHDVGRETSSQRAFLRGKSAFL